MLLDSWTFAAFVNLVATAGGGAAALPGGRLVAGLWFTGLVIIVTFLTAMISWHLWEKHFIALKSLFPLSSSVVRPPQSAEESARKAPPSLQANGQAKGDAERCAPAS